MPELKQAEYTRALRGDEVKIGEKPQIEPIVMGISSNARAAVRKVHNLSPEEARAYYRDATLKHILKGGLAASTARSYERSLVHYIDWNEVIQPVDIDVEIPAIFGDDDSVRAIAHVVTGEGDKDRTARILLWDELPIDDDVAEMIALPVLDCADEAFGSGATTTIEVWQLAAAQRISVPRLAAEGRRADVRQFLAELNP